MRHFAWSTVSLLLACSSSADGPSPPVDSAIADTAADSAIDSRPEVESGPVVDISGTTEITGNIVALDLADFAGPQPPIADMAVRIENAAGGFIDGKTDGSGKVSFEVDASKGPFDVTFAKAGFQVISLLGVSAPFGEVQAFPNPIPSPTLAASGSILGKAAPANKVLIDGHGVSSKVTTSASYSTAVFANPSLGVEFSAIETDASGKAINGILTPAVARTASIKRDIVFPSPANAPTLAAVSVHLPTTGPFAGATWKAVSGSPGLDAIALALQSAGNSFRLVGIGQATPSTAGVSSLSLQTFGGALAPELVAAAWSDGANGFARVSLRDSTVASFEFPPVTALAIDGTSFDDLRATASGTGWSYAEIDISDGGPSVWRVVGGASMSARGLPHLPASIHLADLGLSSPVASVGLFQTKDGKPVFLREFDASLVTVATGALDPTGR